MTHLAMWEVPEQGAEVEWGDLVTNEEYEIPGVERPTSDGETPYFANCSASQVQCIIGPR
jgi:hypothetical protein